MKQLRKTICLFTILALLLSHFTVYAMDSDSLNQEKVVYLTFDDGPSGKLMKQLLDILKENNVHATFFLIGKLVQQEKVNVKRLADEGHSLGLHTYSHERNKIYRSEESFIKEMLDTQQVIYEVTGVKTNILRFPFGCNSHAYRLSTSMVNELHAHNFKIYDWNVDSTDGMNPYMESYKIAQRAKSTKNPAIVLMHCGYVNKNSIKAIQEVIDYYKKNGYTFKTIDENTPELYKITRKKN